MPEQISRGGPEGGPRSEHIHHPTPEEQAEWTALPGPSAEELQAIGEKTPAELQVMADRAVNEILEEIKPAGYVPREQRRPRPPTSSQTRS